MDYTNEQAYFVTKLMLKKYIGNFSNVAQLFHDNIHSVELAKKFLNELHRLGELLLEVCEELKQEFPYDEYVSQRVSEVYVYVIEILKDSIKIYRRAL